MNEKDRESILEIGNETHRLKCGLYLIGRNTEDIEHHIPINDKSVDIKHAILEISQNNAILTDLFTKNGTYVDDICLQKGEPYKLHNTSPSSIKFGNIFGHFRLSSIEDSGYHGFNSPSHQQNNISDIIPASPERNISQKTTRSRLLGLISKINNTISQNTNSLTKSISPPSIFVPSTQINKSSVQDESIRKNIEWLEEEDDFYIPETQEVFQKHNERNSLQGQQQKQNRIFDDTESMMRICTQDFNVVDEKTTDSDDLLRNIVMPIDEQSTSVKEVKITENNDMKDNELNLKKNVTDGDDNNSETDCEDEMSALKWNESSSNKNKSIIINGNSNKLSQISNKSASITPDLEIEIKQSHNKVDEPKSCSVTPDLDVTNNLLSKVGDSFRTVNKDYVDSKSGSTTPDFDVIAINLKSEKLSLNQNDKKDQENHNDNQVVENDDDDGDDYLGPTQPFIRKPFTKVIIGSKIENSLKISPSNKENAPTIANNEQKNVIDDDGLAATQIFVYDKNQFNVVIENNSFNKEQLSKDLGKQGDDENFLKPTITMATMKKSVTSISKPTTSISNDKDNKKKDDTNVNDDDDDMLEATQIFARPSHISVVTSKNLTSTNVTSSTSSSSSGKTKKSISPPTSVLSQFNFDICTPNWDCLKLPTEEKIKEAGKIFSEISKNQRHEKYIFEESSSSLNSSDDEYDVNKQVAIKTVGKEKKVKKMEEKPKVENKADNKPMMTRTRKNEENLKKKVDITENIEERRNLRQATRAQKISEDSDNVKLVENKKEKKEQSTRGRRRAKPDEEKLPPKVEIQVVTKCVRRTTRLTSKDTDTSSNKSGHKRSNDEIYRDDFASKRKRKNDESSIPEIKIQLKKPKIVFTKVDSMKYKNELKIIGAKIVNNPQDCTILVAEQVFWTWKLMAAMAKGIPIVSPKWIEDAAKTPNNLPSVDNYIIKDQQSERKFKFNLKKSMITAREKPIFAGYSFLITPKTKPPPEELIKIIDCGKGKVLRKAPVNDNGNFYVISDKDDMIMWHKIRKSCPNVQIINTEGIMMAALQQRINFKNYLLS